MSSNNNGDAERVADYLTRHPMQALGSTVATTTTDNGGGGGGAGGVGAASCGFSDEHLVLAHQLENLSRRLAKLEGDGGGGPRIEQRALANPAPLGLWVRPQPVCTWLLVDK